MDCRIPLLKSSEIYFGTVSCPVLAEEEHSAPEKEVVSVTTPKQFYNALVALQHIIKKIPRLTIFGLGIYTETSRSPIERRKKFDAERTKLLEAEYLAQFEKCVCWLNHEIWPTSRINKKYSSYGLKHIAERDIGYVTNGVFIAAAVHCGFRWKVDGDDDPNPCFNVSTHAVEAAIRRQELDKINNSRYNYC